MELIDDDYQNKTNSFSQEAGGGKATVRAYKCVRVYVGDGGVSVNNAGTSVPEASA